MLTNLRRRHFFLRATALAVAFAFLNLYLQPLALAANLPDSPETQTPREPTNEEKLSKNLETIEARLGTLEAKLARGEDASAEKQALQAARQELDALDTQALADFAAIEARLKEKNLPEVILNRHYEAVNQYKQEMAVLKANLDELDAEPTDEGKKPKAQKAREHLKAKQKKRGPKTRFDPNDMPNKSLEADPNNKPKLTPEEFTRAGLHSNPYVKLAAHGTYTFDRLAGASDPAYLTATTEVVLSPAILAKAEELQHNPVAIYNWVRNNVEWVPSWGATQDAEVTLGSRRGNSLDIASLTIALLRASGIPARYVHGTIEVPEDNFRSWAGGFSNVTAAANFASSGGIPITGITTGGRITKVQMEHIWVEAAMDFRPSRGAVNRSADTWVPLDPSYKATTLSDGLDVAAIAEIEPADMFESFLASGTTNEEEAWVSQLNPASLSDTQEQADQALGSYLTTLPTATVGTVMGVREITTDVRTVLTQSLPYALRVIGARYGSLPETLQNQMTLALGVDILGDLVDSVTFPWARVNNHKVTFYFRPATTADEETLLSLIPEDATELSDLPASIPSYLVYVEPILAVDGQTVVQGTAIRLGEEVPLVYSTTHRGTNGSMVRQYSVIAGSYLNITITGGSISRLKVENVEQKLAEARSILSSGDSDGFALLSGDNLLGDLFFAAGLSYWAQYLTQSHLVSVAERARHGLPMGFGSIGYEPHVRTFFGFPRAIERGTMSVNVYLAWIIQHADGDNSKRLSLGLQTGLLSSALEHVVPETALSTPERVVQGISAAKALAIAQAQGQRIYYLTPQNQASTLPNLALDAYSMSDIQSALAAGKEVLAHTNQISINGWGGAGYVLFDPVSGGGTYRITGGLNGGDLPWGDWAWDLAGASMDIYKLFERLRRTPPRLELTAAVIQATDKLIDGLVKGTVRVAKVQAIEHGNLTRSCLTETQAASLKSALSAIHSLSWVNRIPGISAPGAGYATRLGQYIAYMYVLFTMIHFMNLNDALEECPQTP
ncbi:transglutaminase domain-containing protein [Sulfurifustis variabilis]|uniref:transglutaminase domain-containing protein n=1 Tax=Sulfurifustis variabilis TaxID=1675686 RepID=UPI0014731E91|nr:transglutaminase domain-containing protein [Sulfurifustis variabilis]